MHAQDHSTDSLTSEDLESAKRYLFKRMAEFWEDSYVGRKLRNNAIDSFKKTMGLKDDCEPEIIQVTADLAGEDEISYAVTMNQSHSLSYDDK